MSRFHLTSSEADHVAAKNISKEAGLDSLGEKAELGYYIQTYQKRAINNTNFVEIEDDWICSVGTLIRNGNVGKKPLEEMYKYLTEEGIKTVRQRFVGHYAIAVKLGDEIHIFTDPHGAHQLYYTNPDSASFIISNSLHTVGCCFDSTKVNLLRAIHYAVQSREIGPKSFFEGVYRLYGSQYISIDIFEGEMSVHDLELSIQTLSNNVSIQNAVREYADLLRNVFNQVKGIDSVALNTTGGLDTRTILAGALDRGINPLLIYGVGNSRLTNTKRSDLRIAKKLSEQFDLPFYRMDWSGQHPHSDEKNLTNFKKFGFKYTTYGSADSLLKELGGEISPYPRLQLSGYGPVLSNSAPWEYPKKEYSIEDLVELLSQDLFYSESSIRTEEYESYLTQEIQTALAHTDIEYPETGATLSSLVQAQTFLRVRAAAGMINFTNEFNYFFAPFMMKRLHDPLVTVPMEFRSKNEFQVRLTHLLNEDTLINTVFSGVEPQKIDWDTYTMENPKLYNFKQTALSNASLLIPNILLPTVKRMYNYLNADPDDDMSINKEIRNNSSDYILENDLTSDYITETAHFGLRDLNKLHRVLFGVDKIIDGNACVK